MAEGPNDWEWQVGLATHEWKAAALAVPRRADLAGTGAATLKPLSIFKTKL
jgi:hypothetical protein